LKIFIDINKPFINFYKFIKYVLFNYIVIDNSFIKSEDLLEHIYKPKGIIYKQAEKEFNYYKNSV